MNKITTLLLAILVAINSRPVYSIQLSTLGMVAAVGAMSLLEAQSIKQVEKHKLQRGILDMSYCFSLLRQDSFWSNRQLSTIIALEQQGKLSEAVNCHNFGKLFVEAVVNGDEKLSQQCISQIKKRRYYYNRLCYTVIDCLKANGSDSLPFLHKLGLIKPEKLGYLDCFGKAIQGQITTNVKLVEEGAVDRYETKIYVCDRTLVPIGGIYIINSSFLNEIQDFK